MTLVGRHADAGVDLELLRARADALGVRLDGDQCEQFARYYRVLTDWGRRVSLTSVTGWEQVQARHFLDSLMVAAVLPQGLLDGGRVLDVGSGGGFPGLPLKIAFPGLRMGLLEATGKKVAFLRELVGLLGLSGVEVYHGRAEELGHDPELREGFGAVLVRGLAKMPVLVELTLPFVRIGGVLAAQKKGEFASEVAGAQGAVAVLGGGSPEVRWLSLPGVLERRAVVLVPKIASTPSGYPRRPGMPTKRPLAPGQSVAVRPSTGAGAKDRAPSTEAGVKPTHPSPLTRRGEEGDSAVV
jgi:16S rRNA (guanine527-N7)-methyltransferase